MNIDEMIEDFKEQGRMEDLEWKRRMALDIKRHELFLKDNQSFFSNFRNSGLRMYKEWLRGYLENGGKPTHFYNYNFPIDDFRMAKNNFIVIPLHGASSFQIIVPKGITYEGENLGHINIYDMNDFSLKGHWVPIYEDIHF